MNSVIIGAMLALSMGQQTDTTFAVGSSELLRVETMGGSITVGVWDRDEVRVQAEHSRRTYISIDRSRHSIRVESEARRGPANLVDFRITVPRTFALDLGPNTATSRSTAPRERSRSRRFRVTYPSSAVGARFGCRPRWARS